MSSFGITINEKHSFKDFKLTIKNKKIGIPKKKKIKESLPYMNGSYDFTALYGEPTYDDRELEYSFNVIGENKFDLNSKKMKILEWLTEKNTFDLFDDTLPEYYFKSTIEELDFNEQGNTGELNLKLSCYPFKICKKLEGNDVWDIFNFESDFAQINKFNIQYETKINLFNCSSINVVPTIVATSTFTIVKDNFEFKINPGITTDWRFYLNKGDNPLIINGVGEIEFKFRKEVL